MPAKKTGRDYIEQVEQYFIAHWLVGEDKEPIQGAPYFFPGLIDYLPDAEELTCPC